MLERIFLHQKQFALKLRGESLDVRIEALEALEKSIELHKQDIIDALKKDFQKPEAETLLSEIYPVLKEITYAKKNLSRWAKGRRVPTPLTLFGSKSYIVPEARGVCLLIAPWNYPFQLAFSPLVSAIASGNCAIMKPSEQTRHTSSIIKKITTEAFHPDHVFVAEGGPETTQELLSFAFDHIFFTGSTRVGKIVMTAAAKNLASVTLELGGKSPTIVDATANLAEAAEKIAWAKFINAGQTCVAPDYLFVHESVQHNFKKHLIAALEKFYGKSAEQRKQSPDFARMISFNHSQRLKDLIDEAVSKNAKVFFGGESQPEEHYCGPTLIEGVDPHSLIMQEEIFGPILPVMTFKEISEVIHFINERPKPLALYCYTHSQMNMEKIEKETSSGGLVYNDSVIHFANPHLPFGGVNHSGMGSYHGKHGFLEFSHQKAVLKQSFLGKLLRVMYPPYTEFKMTALKNLIRFRL
ncbi:aldehyde dehydrogenase family protein [Bdellovibrio bacteriovorus]|uniref:aldehyde dehydrogenase family protein n=1 Tax=Bdellovibrio bacteriovorus TaxID=959 RepID=UPI00045BEB39|nr:aldehyde dehydrogenase family protein [Bdellovibrio bacteriovorus]AHZ84803.1 aldehyde dehydrogenase [Bdellovibrio bacteriovorus]BEV68689.1 Aldehyde dehydrogenase [Bdellovibrio bacteriovorus]